LLADGAQRRFFQALLDTGEKLATARAAQRVTGVDAL
jgi:hypothetical protein